MKKLFNNLPFRLLLGVVAGILIGQIANEGFMNIVVTVKYILGQLITFCVPLIIIGFIAPSITKLGNNASRMLGVAIVIAYVSSVLAALLSMLAGYGLIPHLSIVSEVDGLKELPGVVFQLDIPQIMPVMSALVFSVMIGLAAAWTKAKVITQVLDEFQVISPGQKAGALFLCMIDPFHRAETPASWYGIFYLLVFAAALLQNGRK